MYKPYKKSVINFIISNSGTKFLYTKLTSPLFLTSTFFLILFALFTPIYEENDDVTITSIISGAYTGEPNPHPVYINIILGKFLAMLYRIYPDLNWYSTFLYGVAFISLLSLLSVVVNKIKSKLLLTFSVLFVFIFYLRFLLFFQYTTIAALAATSGIFLFLFLVNNNKGNTRFAYTIAYNLLFISSLIRDQAFYLIMILAIPIMIAVYIEHVLKRRAMIFFLLIVMLGVGVTRYIHDMSYDKNPGWNKFMQLQNPRGQLSSRDLYNYNQNKQIYDNANWNKNDYLMFNTWFYYNEATFSAKKIQFILSSIKYKNFNSIILRDTFSRFISSNLLILPFTLLVILISIANWPLIKNKVPFIATCFIGLFILIYFSYLGWLPQRVSLPIIFFIGSVGIYFTSKYNLLTLNKLGILKISFYIFSVSLILSFIPFYAYSSIENKNKIIEYQDIFKYLPDGKDKLIFIWDSSLPLQWLQPFDNYSRFKNRSIISGGWTQRTPHDLILLKKFNANNIYTALYENNNIYLIAIPQYTELLQIFMKEHYSKNVSFESLHNFKFTYFPYNDTKTQLYKVKLKNTP